MFKWFKLLVLRSANVHGCWMKLMMCFVEMDHGHSMGHWRHFLGKIVTCCGWTNSCTSYEWIIMNVLYMVNRLSLSFCICALFLTIPQGVCRISIKCMQIRCDVFGPSPRKALYRRGLARNSSGDVEAQSGYRARKENDGKEMFGQRSMGWINKFAIKIILRCTWCINHDRVLVSLRSPSMAYVSWFFQEFVQFFIQEFLQ